jgi:hypothetical protein
MMHVMKPRVYPETTIPSYLTAWPPASDLHARPKNYPEAMTMSEDDLVREVRAARDEYCRQFGYDLGAIVRDLREQERTGGREVVRLPPRRTAPTDREITGSPS